MGITQKEIAKNLGISYMTVSRALKSNGYVSDALKQRVLEYAKEMGYEPHRASQVLVRNSTRKLALFSSTLPRYFWDEINKGVQVAAQQLKAFDYEVHYHRVPELDTKPISPSLSRRSSKESTPLPWSTNECMTSRQ